MASNRTCKFYEDSSFCRIMSSPIESFYGGHHGLTIIVICFFTWLGSRAIYRLLLHPLAKFPGPKLAAVTHWYEGYYEIMHHGRYIFEVEKMHKIYGSIVRIGPDELHILDADFYDRIYDVTNYKVDKYSWFYSMLGNPQATFPTIRADVHRQRRGALNPFFSISAISKLQPTIQSAMDKLSARMHSCAERNGPIPLFYAYRCLTVDIISDYAYAGQLGMLDRDDWGESFYSAWRSLWEMSGIVRQWPFIMDIFMAMPRWLTALVSPKALEVVDMKTATDEQTRRVLETDPEVYKARPYPTIMWGVANDPSLPPQEKSFERLAVEANSILAAGFETTGGVLSLMTFLVLDHPEIHKRLKEELEAAIPDPDTIPSWQVLEKLPLLSGVVKESLRLAVGAFSRLPRVSPESIQYKQWTIPPYTAVGMSALFISMSPDIFPDPENFDPDRWGLPRSATRRHLEHYLHPFGGGSRLCVGINLAYAELYSVIATIIRRFPDMVLFETTKRDMELVHDYFGGMARRECAGLKVKLSS